LSQAINMVIFELVMSSSEGRNQTKKQSCQALADCPASRGGLSARATRTVQPGAADNPQRCRGQSGRKPRTVQKCHQNHQRRTKKNGPSAKTGRTVRAGSGPSARDPDRPLLKLGPSGNQLQRKPKTKLDQNKNTKNITMNWDELSPRGQSTGSGRTVRQFKQNWKSPSSRSQLHLLITRSPKW
jgi:hypothetical protein